MTYRVETELTLFAAMLINYTLIIFEMRYRCTAGKCIQYEITTNDSSVYTLIMRKNTQVARAADPVTGAERCIHK